MSDKGKNVLLALMTLFIFQEIAFRVSFPIPELSNFDRAAYTPGGMGEEKIPFYRNSKWYWESSLDTNHQFLHKLNQYGFRDGEWKVRKGKDKKRILMVGDSFLEGIMADQSQTITEGFKRLDQENKFDVMNLGIMGSGINSYLEIIADAVPIFRPDKVCIILYSNDLSDKFLKIPTDRLVPKFYNKLKPRALEVISQSKNGEPLLSRFNFKERPFLPSIKDNNFPWKNEEILLKHTSKAVSESIKNGTSNPFKLNQILREKSGLSNQPNLTGIFPFLINLGKEFNTEFVIYYIPARHQVTNYYYQYDKAFCKSACPDYLDLTAPFYNQHQGFLQNLCDKNKINFVDFTALIKSKEQANQHLYWNFDDHMKGSGYQLIGQKIYEELSKESN